MFLVFQVLVVTFSPVLKSSNDSGQTTHNFLRVKVSLLIVKLCSEFLWYVWYNCNCMNIHHICISEQAITVLQILFKHIQTVPYINCISDYVHSKPCGQKNVTEPCVYSVLQNKSLIEGTKIVLYTNFFKANLPSYCVSLCEHVLWNSKMCCSVGKRERGGEGQCEECRNFC